MLETLGAVGAVVGILDVVARSVLRLRDMQKRLKEANVNVQMMMGELTATRTALKVLKAGIASSTDKALDEELSAGLDSSLESCSLLVQIIGGTTTAGTIITEGLERPSVIEQAAVIHDTDNQIAISSMKDDTPSLIVLHDVNSMRSRTASLSSSNSKISLRLPGLDEFLSQHKPYQKAFRNLLRRRRGEQPPRNKPRSYDAPSLSTPDIVNVKMSLTSDELLCQIIVETLAQLNAGNARGMQASDIVAKCHCKGRHVGIEGLRVSNINERGLRVNFGPEISLSSSYVGGDDNTILLDVIDGTWACESDLTFIGVDVLVQLVGEIVASVEHSAASAGIVIINIGIIGKNPIRKDPQGKDPKGKEPKKLNRYRRPCAWFLEEFCRKFRTTHEVYLGNNT
ncbi:MAG: hypothetical protein Q9159_001409 [Coniocarpon cinnabarinum]